MTSHTPISRRRRLTALLVIGFVSLSVAVRAAITTQPIGMELSIYHATPLSFWSGVLIAIVSAALVTVHGTPKSRIRHLALLLGPLAVVTIIALPVLRGYYFFGPSDSLSHLGWARLIEQQRLNPVGLLYPGLHSLAIFVGHATGIPLRRALMTIPSIFVGAFVIFVALTAKRIANGQLALVAGAFAALLLLPINNISTFVWPYPTVEAIFFVPMALYLLFRYVSNSGTGLVLGDRVILTPFGILLGLTTVATILYHPQIGAGLIAMFVMILIIQSLARQLGDRYGETVISNHRMIAVQTLLAFGFFALWAPRFNRTQNALSGVLRGLFGGTPPGAEVAARGSSLAALGGSLLELFLKLFGVSMVLSAIAGVIMLMVVTRRLDGSQDRNALLAYLTVGFVPIFTLFAVFFVAGVSQLPFRYLGFVMLLVTIFVAVGVADGLPWRLRALSPPTRKTLVVVVFLLLLTPQLLMVFTSPYIQKGSGHVPEARVEGFQTSFEHRDPKVQFAGIRTGPRRYVDAEYGTTYSDTTPGGEVFEGKESQIPFAVFGNNMTSHYSRCRYVPIYQGDFERETVMYDGFRYDEQAFESMETSPNIHRIQSNSNYQLYLVETENPCPE